MDGQTSFTKRAKIVQAFQRDPLERVLITSSVGGKGLNLVAANKIIFAVNKPPSDWFFQLSLIDRTSLGVLRMNVKFVAVPTASLRQK
jgi:hypothetical protein